MLDCAQRLLTPLLALALVTACAAACTKSEGTSSGMASATASGSAAVIVPKDMSVTSTTDASQTEAASTDANVAASDAAATPSAKASAGVTASATPAASGSAAAGGECGTKPLPDCPLQAWMKANTNAAVASNDLPSLASALDKTATFAPPGAGYTNWVSIAKDGARAARAGEMAAVKASCRGCHDQYKQKYKTEMRARKI